MRKRGCAVSLGLVVGLLAGMTTIARIRPARADERSARQQSFTLESKTLHETRRINVYEPPGYAEATAIRYPVLYMPDGGLQEDFPHVAADLEAAIRKKELRPMLLVGIENTERRRDTTPPTEVERDKKIAPHVGGAAEFRAFIANELIPEVRRRYRTSSEAGIIGESLAGLFIVDLFFAQPELFHTYIALSPSLWWNHEEIVRKAAAMLKTRPQLAAELYLSSANEEEIVAATGKLADILRQNAPPRLKWQYEPRPDLRHDNIYRMLSPALLRKAFPPRP